jgi:TP901 family phage tail tape measure protein
VAKELGDLIVRLSLDSSRFENSLEKFEAQMTKVLASCMSAATGLTSFKKVTEKLKVSADTLSERLNLQKERVSELERAYEASKTAKGADAEETKKLAAKLEEARQKLTQTEQALKLVNEQIKLNKNGFYQFGVNLENVGAKLQSVGKKISETGTQLTTKVTAPVIALGTACITTFTGFDDSMKQVQATMGLVAGSSVEADKSIAMLSATAKEMGATTKYTASDAADALNYLAMAGYTAEQACEALPDVLNLAQSGGLDLAYASDLATDAMSALGLQMSDLGTFSDQLAVAAQKSNTNVGQLGEAILTVGGTAKNLAGGTVELATGLGILADNGIKGAEGGTALRNVILSLTAPTDQAAKRMKKLGLNVYDAQGDMRPMNDILNDLNGVMGDMSQKQKTNLLNTLFNKTDLKAVNALLANSGARFDELSGYIENSDGAAAQMAATMESGIGGAFRELQSAVEGVAIAFGERLAPYIKLAAEKITELANRFAMLSPKTQDMIIKIAAIAAAVGPALLVFGKLTTGVGSLMKVFGPLFKILGGAKNATGALSIAFKALTGPVGIIAAVIGVVIAVMMRLYKTNSAFRDKINGIWAQITAAFQKVQVVFGAVLAKMKGYLAPVKAAMDKLWQSVESLVLKLMPVFEAVAVVIGAVLAVVVALAAGIMDMIAPLVQALIQATDFIIVLVSAIVSLFSGDWNGFVTAISAAWEALKASLLAIWDAVCNLFFTFWTTLCGIADAFGLNLNQFFTDLWTGIQTAATTAWTAFTTWLSGVWTGISTTATTAWNSVCSSISSAVESGKEGIATAWSNVTTAVSDAWTAIQTTASTAWASVCTSVASAVENGKASISTAWTAISTAVEGVWTSVKTAAGTAWSGIGSAVGTAVTTAQTGIVSAWTAVKSAVQTVWDGVLGILKSPIEAASTWLSEKVEWLKGLFGFKWKLPEFKLPTIEVTWNEVGWGIKIPSLSLNWNALGGIFDQPTIFATAGAGLQGVGEAGAEAILPLDTLWQEMSERLKAGIREVMRDMNRSKDSTGQDASVLSALLAYLKQNGQKNPDISVTQNIYADETSYVGQQMEAARQLRQLARGLA